MRIFYNTAKSPQLLELSQPADGSWLHLEAPTPVELESLAKQYNLDVDLLADGIDPNEAPRIEKDGTSTFIYTRYCLPEAEKLTTAPLLIVHAKGVTITICRQTFTHLEQIIGGQISVITSKRAQLTLELLQTINTGYKRRIYNSGRRILQSRSLLDREQISNKDFISFIDIEEDLNDFLLVLEPMAEVLTSLLSGKFMKLYEEDRDLIQDLALGNQELTRLAQSQLSTLRNIREAYSTIMANSLNRVFKLMTSITILMGIFTLITGVYSMNIALPASHDPNAFWIILGITGAAIGAVSYYFKKNRWF